MDLSDLFDEILEDLNGDEDALARTPTDVGAFDFIMAQFT